jgi:hypothetical protein
MCEAVADFLNPGHRFSLVFNWAAPARAVTPCPFRLPRTRTLLDAFGIFSKVPIKRHPA